MVCQKCGTPNNDGSKFCIKCGNSLEVGVSNMTNTINYNNQINNGVGVMPNNNFQPNNNLEDEQIKQPINGSLSYIVYILGILLKPIRNFKNEENKLSNSKIAFTLLLIVTSIMTLSTIIKTIISTVRVSSYNFFKGLTYSWEWKYLKDIEWLELIVKNFLIYAGIILAIAIVFYIASLIIKKNLSFIKTLSIAVSSVIPAVLGVMVLSPILGMIWSPLSMIVSSFALIYSFVILYELINGELNLDKDSKVYFNMICFGILLGIGYYIYMKLFMSSISGGLDGILDLFS